MIHPRRGGGYALYYLAFMLAAIAIAVTVAVAAQGNLAIGFEVPWKGIVTLAVIAVVAGVSRLRARRA